MWNHTQERLLCGKSGGSNSLVIIFPAYHMAFVFDSGVDLGLEYVDPEFTSGCHGFREGFRFEIENAVAKVLGGEVVRWVVVEESGTHVSQLIKKG